MKINRLLLIIISLLGLTALLSEEPILHYLLEPGKLAYHVVEKDEVLNTKNLNSDLLHWQEIDYLTYKEKQTIDKLLYRLELPDSLTTEKNRIFFIGYYTPFKVYYNSEEIYSDSKRSNFVHLLTLNYSKEEKYLYFLYDEAIPGYPVPFSLVFLNEDLTDTPFVYLIIELIFVQMLNYSVSIFFFLISLISLFLLLRSSKSIKKHVFAVFIYSLIIGLDHGLNTLLMAYFGISPKIFYWIDSMMFQLFLIMIVTMADYVFSDGKSKFLRFLKYLIICITVINFLVTNLIQFYQIFDFLNISLYVITILYLIFYLIKKFKYIREKLNIFIALIFILAPLLMFVTRNFKYVPYISSVYVLISVSILYIFVYNFFARFRKNEASLVNTKLDLQEKENEILRLEKDRLKNSISHLKGQLNPHFLFNSLSTLTGIIHMDSDKAVNYVEELSNMYRYILQTDNKELIDLESELDLLDSYNYLVSMKYGKNYELNIDIDDDYMDYKLPPLSLQTMIENIFKHNTIDLNHKMKIDIFIADMFIVIINDIHKKESAFQYKEKKAGIGQQNITAIYQYYSERKPIYEIKNNKYIVKIPLIDKDVQYVKDINN